MSLRYLELMLVSGEQAAGSTAVDMEVDLVSKRTYPESQLTPLPSSAEEEESSEVDRPPIRSCRRVVPGAKRLVVQTAGRVPTIGQNSRSIQPVLTNK